MMSQSLRSPARRLERMSQMSQEAAGSSLQPCLSSYEYLDHTADVQVHAWGPTLETAFVSCACAMLNYMFDQSTVEVNQSLNRDFVISDCPTLSRLLYGFLDEVLFLFSCDPCLAMRSLEIVSLTAGSAAGSYSLSARCFGEEYRREKHGSRTEIKAVTYSNLRIVQDATDGQTHVYVIFDI